MLEYRHCEIVNKAGEGMRPRDRYCVKSAAGRGRAQIRHCAAKCDFPLIFAGHEDVTYKADNLKDGHVQCDHNIQVSLFFPRPANSCGMLVKGDQATRPKPPFNIDMKVAF